MGEWTYVLSQEGQVDVLGFARHSQDVNGFKPQNLYTKWFLEV